MFRKKFLVLLLCVLLSGCAKGQDPAQSALDLRTGLMESGGCSFAADVIAHYDDRMYEFSMTCLHDREETRLEVTKPEILAGITASVQSDSTQLEFDGTVLDFGKLANGYVSPVEAPYLLVECWRSAYIAWAGADGTQERITYLRGYEEQELTVDTWLENGCPTYAEVTYDGVRCLAITITDFQMIS